MTTFWFLYAKQLAVSPNFYRYKISESAENEQNQLQAVSKHE